MTNKLLFVRHGESQANVRGVVAGALDDSPLTEKGRDDARLTAEHLRQMMRGGARYRLIELSVRH